jgi:hypothetical protein
MGMPAAKKKPTPKLIWDEDHWRFRAREARNIQDTLRDPDCKRLMNGIAECYERLADLTRDFQKAAAAHMWSRPQ